MKLISLENAPMTTLTFDTHDIIKKFREKGLTEGLGVLHNKDLDLRIKETELKIELVKSELIRWVVAVGVLQTTIITALLIKLTVRM